ncbi:MAG: FHA domain-containing protein, partial [Planctomycetota bacterium]|nr:FHA domain-containing protein [Planctomycetota bacterium]
MSFARLVYYSAVISGWAAFLGWLIAEIVIDFGGSDSPRLETVGAAALVGGAIGAGLNAVAGLSNGQWLRVAMRALPGFVVGAMGGAVGGFVGDFLYVSMQSDTGESGVGGLIGRIIGWVVMGVGIGIVEGVYDRSKTKLRNGLIGGALGGLIGGVLFDPIVSLIGSEMSSRATSFVVLGLFIGALVGLVQVVLKDAWLTVVDGYRAGRQLVITQAETVIGRAEHLPLPFLGGHDTELEHATIRREGGRFVIEDMNTPSGTFVNHKEIPRRAELHDGDVIKIGTNFIRFNSRTGGKGSDGPPIEQSAPVVISAPPPPPSVRPVATGTAGSTAPRPVVPSRPTAPATVTGSALPKPSLPPPPVVPGASTPMIPGATKSPPGTPTPKPPIRPSGPSTGSALPSSMSSPPA